MNTAEIIAGLKTGLETVEKLLPIAGLVGGNLGGAVTVIGLAIVEVADNLLSRAADASIIITSDQITEIEAIRNEMASKNDELAKLIAAS